MTREEIREKGSVGSVGSAEYMNAVQLLPAVIDLYGRYPEYRCCAAWELQWLLFSLGYTEDLADEGEIAAAAEVARQDWPEWWRAA